MQHIEFTFKSKDNLSLLGRAWMTPHAQPKGVIILIHGLGEHSGRYAHVGKALAGAGYHLAGFDLRGHGLSGGKKGHIPNLEILRDDIDRFISETMHRLESELPTFLYGHSLGGNIVLDAGFHHPNNLAGVIATSPCLRTAFKPSKIKIILAHILGKLLPGLIMKSGLDVEALSRDKAVVKAYRDDVYVHDKISASLGLILLETGQYALNHADEWTLPLLLMHGTADQITSHQASQTFTEKAGEPVELVSWDGYYHEIHNEPEREAVIAKMIAWLNQQID